MVLWNKMSKIIVHNWSDMLPERLDEKERILYTMIERFPEIQKMMKEYNIWYDWETELTDKWYQDNLIEFINSDNPVDDASLLEIILTESPEEYFCDFELYSQYHREYFLVFEIRME